MTGINKLPAFGVSFSTTMPYLNVVLLSALLQALAAWIIIIYKEYRATIGLKREFL